MRVLMARFLLLLKCNTKEKKEKKKRREAGDVREKQQKNGNKGDFFKEI